MSVLIVTSLGNLVVDLDTDKCPLTCKNFLKLCKIKYYNGCLFHSVEKDFTAQTGDPTGTGLGGDSIYKLLNGEQARFFSDEIDPNVKHSKIGTLAMASAGKNLNASQFYFTLRDHDLEHLDGKHTVFGEVAVGFETLTRINEAYVDHKNRPYENITIKHTYILYDPFEDQDEVDDYEAADWMCWEEVLDEEEFDSHSLVGANAKEAHSTVAPENVLFVCKLNPVTEDVDLHIKFSQFGTVQSAHIVRHYKSGESLGYAFIEFQTKEACEQAYRKMGDALILDTRIYVDFGHCVPRLWSKYVQGFII